MEPPPAEGNVAHLRSGGEHVWVEEAADLADGSPPPERR